ncbi:hypothetical protein CTN07_00755 [Photobacterium damselae]|nr:hypothetical protein CTN07_00755 [Photobacterium damselae]
MVVLHLLHLPDLKHYWFCYIQVPLARSQNDKEIWISQNGKEAERTSKLSLQVSGLCVFG